MIDIDRILLELELLPHYDNQIMLQTVSGCTDPTYGTGLLLQDHKGTMKERVALAKEIEKKFTVLLWPKLIYTNQILTDLGISRSRVMKMKSRTCYSYHIDPTGRMHIPLKTNENCFFVVEDKIVRLPADGSNYFIDTTKKHTFVNASFEERIHIVGCVGE